MKIAIGSDKSGFLLKEFIKTYLTVNGKICVKGGVAMLPSADGKVFGVTLDEFEKEIHDGANKDCSIISVQVDDLGTADLNAVHPYHQVASDIAPLVQNGSYDRAILVCGTGAGMSVVANKFEGIQAVACESVYSAKMARAINGAQILCMGGWIVSPEMGLEMAKTFLTTDYLEGLEDWRKTWLTNAAAKVKDLENGIYHKK